MHGIERQRGRDRTSPSRTCITQKESIIHGIKYPATTPPASVMSPANNILRGPLKSPRAAKAPPSSDPIKKLLKPRGSGGIFKALSRKRGEGTRTGGRKGEEEKGGRVLRAIVSIHALPLTFRARE
jgi:hypothetical protein